MSVKQSHCRILAAMAYGATIVRLGKSKFAHVSRFLGEGKYETFRVRMTTVDDMELLGLIVCVDQYTEADTEWVLPKRAEPENGQPF